MPRHPDEAERPEELEEVETFSKPGTADVTPSDTKKIAPLAKHYLALPHPFTSCVRDQVKHGLSKDHANRRCAVLLDKFDPTRAKHSRMKEGLETEEAVLTSKARKGLPKSAFVFPGEKRYPIHDLAHARNALARSSGKPEEAKVRAAVYARYPALKKGKKDTKEAKKGCFLPHEAMAKKGKAKCPKCGADLKKELKETAVLPTDVEIAEWLATVERRLVAVEGALGPLSEPNTAGKAGIVKAAWELIEAPLGEPVRLTQMGGPPAEPRAQAQAAKALLTEATELRALAKSLGGEVREAKDDPVADAERRMSKAQSRSPRGRPTEAHSGLALKQGESGERVEQAQARLKTLGYDVTVDGDFGDETADSVRSFQRDHDLKEDGFLGDKTRIALRGTTPEDVEQRRAGTNGAEPAAEGEAEEPAEPAESPSDAVWLSKGKGVGSGDGDPAVKAAQEAMVGMGTYVGEAGPDGRFGPETEKGTKRIQRRYGLKADGMIGPETWSVLKRQSENGGKEKLEEAEALLEAAKSITTPYGTTTWGGNTGKAKGRGGQAVRDPEYEKKHPRAAKGRTGGGQFIRSGSSALGSAVAKEVGGGGNFQQAIKRYQRQNDLAVDGIVGHQTASAILGKGNAAKVAPGALSPEDKRKLRKRLLGNQGKKKLAEAESRADKDTTGDKTREQTVKCPECGTEQSARNADCEKCGASLDKVRKAKFKERAAANKVEEAKRPDSDFALPGRRYPIYSEKLAQNALARVAQDGYLDERKQVREAVKARYPDIDVGAGALALQEATLRGAFRKSGELLARISRIRRLPDGTFAPEGRGRVLRAGDTVELGGSRGKVNPDGKTVTVAGRRVKLASPSLQSAPDADADAAVRSTGKERRALDRRMRVPSTGTARPVPKVDDDAALEKLRSESYQASPSFGETPHADLLLQMNQQWPEHWSDADKKEAAGLQKRLADTMDAGDWVKQHRIQMKINEIYTRNGGQASPGQGGDRDMLRKLAKMRSRIDTHLTDQEREDVVSLIKMTDGTLASEVAERGVNKDNSRRVFNNLAKQQRMKMHDEADNDLIVKLRNAQPGGARGQYSPGVLPANATPEDRVMAAGPGTTLVDTSTNSVVEVVQGGYGRSDGKLLVQYESGETLVVDPQGLEPYPGAQASPAMKAIEKAGAAREELAADLKKKHFPDADEVKVNELQGVVEVWKKGRADMYRLPAEGQASPGQDREAYGVKRPVPITPAEAGKIGAATGSLKGYGITPTGGAPEEYGVKRPGQLSPAQGGWSEAYASVFGPGDKPKGEFATRPGHVSLTPEEIQGGGGYTRQTFSKIPVGTVHYDVFGNLRIKLDHRTATNPTRAPLGVDPSTAVFMPISGGQASPALRPGRVTTGEPLGDWESPKTGYWSGNYAGGGPDIAWDDGTYGTWDEEELTNVDGQASPGQDTRRLTTVLHRKDGTYIVQSRPQRLTPEEMEGKTASQRSALMFTHKTEAGPFDTSAEAHAAMDELVGDGSKGHVKQVSGLGSLFGQASPAEPSAIIAGLQPGESATMPDGRKVTKLESGTIEHEEWSADAAPPDVAQGIADDELIASIEAQRADVANEDDVFGQASPAEPEPTEAMDPDQVGPDTRLKEVLETAICGRCGGTGHYSFNQIDGTMCYGCRGKKVRYTKRGSAARQFYEDQLQTPVEDIKVGDKVFDRTRGWAKVTGISPATGGHIVPADDPRVEAAKARGAEVKPYTNAFDKDTPSVLITEGVNVETTKVTHVGVTGEMATAPSSDEERTELIRKTAEYQQNLTKAGKPRKQKGGQASPGQAATDEQAKLRALVKEARQSKKRFPSDERIVEMSDGDLAAWAIARDPRSVSRAQWEHRELQKRQASVKLRPELEKAETMDEARALFNDVVDGLIPGEQAKLPNGVVVKRYKDRGWGKRSYSVQTPDGKRRGRTLPYYASRDAFTMGPSEGGQASPGQGTLTTRKGQGGVIDEYVWDKPHPEPGMTAGRVVATRDRYMWRVHEGDPQTPGTGRAVSSTTMTDAQFEAAYPRLHEYANEPPPGSIDSMGVQYSPAQALGTDQRGQPVSKGDRVMHNGRMATIVGSEPAFREDAVMGDPGFVPGKRDPTLKYDDSENRYADITVPSNELTKGQASPGQLGPENYGVKGRSFPMPRPIKPSYRKPAAVPLASVDGQVVPVTDRTLVPDIREAYGVKRPSGQYSPGVRRASPSTFAPLADDTLGSVDKGTLLFDMWQGSRTGGRNGIPQPYTVEKVDDVTGLVTVKGSIDSKALALHNSHRPGVARFSAEEFKALHDRIGGEVGPEDHDKLQEIAADDSLSDPIRNLAAYLSTVANARARAERARKHPQGEYGLSVDELEDEVQTGDYTRTDAEDVPDYIEDLARDIQRDWFRNYVYGGGSDQQSLLERLEDTLDRYDGNEQGTSRGVYSDEDRYADEIADAYIDAEAERRGEFGQWSPGQLDSDGQASPPLVDDSYQDVLLRNGAELDRFGETNLPSGATITQTPDGIQISANGTTGVVKTFPVNAVYFADALDRAPSEVRDTLREAWRDYTEGDARQAKVLEELGGLRLGQASPGDVPAGFQPNTSSTELGEVPEGTMFVHDGYGYVIHKSNGNWIIAKPVDPATGEILTSDPAPSKYQGEKRRIFHFRMPPGAFGDFHPDYAEEWALTPDAPSHAAATEDQRTSPAYSAKGNLRNIKVMNDAKLKGLWADMSPYAHVDPKAYAAVHAEMDARGFNTGQAPVSAPAPSPATVSPKGPKKPAATPVAAQSASDDELYDLLKKSVAQASSDPAGDSPPASYVEPGEKADAADKVEADANASFGMFTAEGGDAVKGLVRKIIAAPKDERAGELEAGLEEIGKDHPEVTDTAVREEMGAALKAADVPLSDVGWIDLEAEQEPKLVSTPSTNLPSGALTQADVDKAKAGAEATGKAGKAAGAPKSKLAKSMDDAIAAGDTSGFGIKEPPKPLPPPGSAPSPDDDQKTSPAYSAKGNLRNITKMTDTKLAGLAEQMDDYEHEDPYAYSQVAEEMTGRGIPMPGSEDPDTGQIIGTPPEPSEPPPGIEAIADQTEAEGLDPGANKSDRIVVLTDAEPGHTQELPNGTKIVKTQSTYLVVKPTPGDSYDSPEVFSDATAAVNRAEEWDAEPEVTEADQRLADAAQQLGPDWDNAAVQSALAQLETQGITLDPAVENADTLVAVINAAGMKP